MNLLCAVKKFKLKPFLTFATEQYNHTSACLDFLNALPSAIFITNIITYWIVTPANMHLTHSATDSPTVGCFRPGCSHFPICFMLGVIKCRLSLLWVTSIKSNKKAPMTPDVAEEDRSREKETINECFQMWEATGSNPFLHLTGLSGWKH